MQLYDMHSHILPAFDDGAKTIEDSLALIDCLKKQGVSNICLTPHYYTNERSFEDFLTKRQQAFEKFRPYIPQDVNIVLGAEVYVTDYLFNNDDLTGITIQGIFSPSIRTILSLAKRQCRSSTR